MRGSLHEVRELLKRFGLIVYTGDEAGDAVLMELELHDLHEMGLIEEEDYKKSLLQLKRFQSREKERNHP
jgi:uncharacterized protein YqgQ